MNKLMKKFLILLLCVFVSGTAGSVLGEGDIPEIILDPPVINRVADPEAEPGFYFPEDAKLLHIWFPNIMNADEAILIYGGEVWLIDCGDEKMGARGAELIGKLEIDGVDKLFNTHPHHDHLNGLQNTDKAAKVSELLFCVTQDTIRHANSAKRFREALAYAEKNNIAVSFYEEGSVFAMGDGAVTLTCYVNTDLSLDLNNRSAQMMLRYGKRTILFMGDMEKPGQKAMLERVSTEELKADLLKYPHHGKSAMDDLFLEAVSPEAAIITNKKVEDWKGVKYLKKKKIPYIYTNVYRNKKCMYLHLVTDGENWVLERVMQDDVMPF